MKVWLLHIGEELPVDGPERPFRYGYLARALERHGHQVLRWAPTFRHTAKVQRYAADTRVDITDNYAIQFVYAPGYRRNTSIERLRTYHVLGRRFRKLARREELPDAIVAAIPSLEWADAAVEFGRARNIPVVVDVRDLWPDAFPSALPAWARPAGRLLIAPYWRAARRACQRADELCAVSESYLKWGLRLAGRERQARDLVLPLGYEPEPIPAAVLQENIAQLRGRGIDPERPVCYFAGALERHHEVDTVIAAAGLLHAAGRKDVQFVICGNGSRLESLRQQAQRLPNIHFLGWVDAAMLQAVASISVIGLCAYAHGTTISLGNKPFEYLAGRLAIASSLPGDLAEMLARHRCGVTYRAGSPQSLATCLQEMLNAPERLSQMRANAHEAWRKYYRSRDIYARFVEHLAALQPAAAKAA